MYYNMYDIVYNGFMRSRAVIYLRVSTERQSTEIQELELKKFVEARGWELTGIYEDKVSGATSNRSGLQRMLTDARLSKFEIIVTFKLDRFFRSLRELLNTLELLNQINVEFVAVRDNFDLTTSAGRLMVSMLGAIAQFERELINARVVAGIENARRKGVKFGRPKTVREDEIHHFHRKGLSLAGIAKRVGCSKSAVHKVIKQASSTNSVLNCEIIQFENDEISGHKSNDLETARELAVGATQSHESEYQCHEMDLCVTNENGGPVGDWGTDK
jgi:DNA invertase Pin-like site-specific DNA recombinase